MTLTKDSVIEQVNKFLQFWNNGQKASFKIECENGEAVMDLSVCFQSSRKTRHSPSKIKRNKERADIYRRKKQLAFSVNAENLHDHLDLNDEHTFDVNSDFNGNEELVNSIDENRFSSQVSCILGTDNDYQICYMNDENCDDHDLNSNEPGQDHEMECSDQDESENEDKNDTEESFSLKRNIELVSEEWEFDNCDDVFHMNPDSDQVSKENIVLETNFTNYDKTDKSEGCREEVEHEIVEEEDPGTHSELHRFKTNLMMLKTDIWRSGISEENKLFHYVELY